MTAVSEAEQYDGPVRRIRRIIVVLGVAGAIAVTLVYGWQSGLGFLLCAAVSYSSFWRQQRVVESLGPETQARRPPLRRFLLQIAFFGAAAYVIVKYLEVNRLAAVSGLLVAAAAVLLEIIYELIYGARS